MTKVTITSEAAWDDLAANVADSLDNEEAVKFVMAMQDRYESSFAIDLVNSLLEGLYQEERVVIVLPGHGSERAPIIKLI